MAVGAVLATQLNTGAAHPYGLFLTGLDIVKEPVSARYGVDLNSVRVTEAAPGSVSSMSFTIDDPAKLITIPTYCPVLFWDFLRDLPIFRGFVQNVQTVADFGQQGRSFQVTCYGIEALLDQIIIPDKTVRATDDAGSGLDEFQIIEMLGAYAPGLRVAKGSGTTFTSNLTTPIQDSGEYFYFGAALDISGQTIRSAFETLLAGSTYSSGGIYPRANVALTVDFWGNVRGYWWGNGLPTTTLPGDYATLTITETSTPRAERLTWSVDTSPAAVVTAVYVKGGNAATTGWVLGDTTQGVGQRYISDSALLFDFEMQDVAGPLITGRGTAAGRGTLDLDAYTPTNLRPGSLLTITNAALGWTAKQFVVSQVDKSGFTGDGRQDWHLTFFEVGAAVAGGQPSAMDTVRTLTRAVAN